MRAPLPACSSLHPPLHAQMSAARRVRGLYVIASLSRSVGCRAAARQTARRGLSRRLLRAAGAAPGGALFGPQVAQGRAGDGPKVFTRWDAAPVPLSGPLLAICFRVDIRCLPPPGSCYRWGVKSAKVTEWCSFDSESPINNVLFRQYIVLLRLNNPTGGWKCLPPGQHGP